MCPKINGDDKPNAQGQAIIKIDVTTSNIFDESWKYQ